ncbi:cupredoxin domain-containing protein [Paenibacillus sp. GYB003]|jgi:nitrosocyanin|uniref:cupredoxin domain-containing protein n=1 Tax=Paenibacillus sp. GYB003 TaxID=2994392 RepID=UPI002F961656
MGYDPMRRKPDKRGAVRIFVFGRRKLLLAAGIALLAAAYLLYVRQERTAFVSGTPAGERTVHMVTGEFKSTLENGKEIEAYRWDPGTVVVRKGEKVRLSITGVNGASHPFIIEGLGIRGEVKKGEETIVSFKADKPGIYRIICLTHPDFAHGGPMIGYIVVD